MSASHFISFVVLCMLNTLYSKYPELDPAATGHIQFFTCRIIFIASPELQLLCLALKSRKELF